MGYRGFDGGTIYALAKDIGHDVKKLDEVRCKKMLGEDPLSKGYA